MSELRKAIVFQDIRESTRLLFSQQDLSRLTTLISAYYMALAGAVEMAGFRRGQYALKTIGDGAMISLPTRDSPEATLTQILVLVRAFQAYIPLLVKSYNSKFNTNLDLRFGWGISMGPVHPLGKEQVQNLFDIAPGGASLLDGSLPDGVIEFIGPCVVRASRLCGLARPEGVVIDAEAFPDKPRGDSLPLRSAEAQLKGFAAPLPIWASKDIEPQPGLTLDPAARENGAVAASGLC